MQDQPGRRRKSGASEQTESTSACFRDPTRATTSNPLGLNIIPASRFNSSGLALLQYFPLPNAIGARTPAGGAYNYVVQSPVDVPKRSQVIRFDVKPSDKLIYGDYYLLETLLWLEEHPKK